VSLVGDERPGSGRIDGVKLAVLSRRLDSIAARMQNTLLRTARSGVINNGRDFSCCILTADARLITVGESLPIHVMAGPDLMSRTMLEFHPHLERGDAFLHN
jgi:N-methylhydantoinase B